MFAGPLCATRKGHCVTVIVFVCPLLQDKPKDHQLYEWFRIIRQATVIKPTLLFSLCADTAGHFLLPWLDFVFPIHGGGDGGVRIFFLSCKFNLQQEKLPNSCI
jgi:hypothetical protein